MKKVKNTTISRSGYNTCSYYCNQDTGYWTLYEDNSEPGYWCPDIDVECGYEDDTKETDAIEIESLTASAPSKALPKDSALYVLERTRKLLRRVRGKWSKGMMAPHEITFKELAKIDKKLAETAVTMAKNKSVADLYLIVPAQKTGSTKTNVAGKKKAAKSSTKAVAKKSTGKTKRPS